MEYSQKSGIVEYLKKPKKLEYLHKADGKVENDRRIVNWWMTTKRFLEAAQ